MDTYAWGGAGFLALAVVSLALLLTGLVAPRLGNGPGGRGHQRGSADR